MTTAMSMAARLASSYGVPEQTACELAMSLALDGPWSDTRRPLAAVMEFPMPFAPEVGATLKLPAGVDLRITGVWHRAGAQWVVVGVAVGP